MSSPFPMPVLFTAWTWHDGAGIAGEVIRRAKLGGFKTVAVELSENTGGDPGSTLDAQDVQYLKDAGLFVVGWGPVDSRLTAELGLALDGWLPQVETQDQRIGLIAALKSGAAAGLPRALVTTYGGLSTTADVAELVKAWGGMPFTFVECYAADDAIHADISRMLSQGVVYGFKADALRALVGTYRGELPGAYTGLTSSNYGGAYLEEPMTDDQLRAFAAYAAPAPPPPPEPNVTNDAAARNAQVASITQAWLDNFGPAPLSRMACAHDVSASTDDVWYSRRQDVRDALDGKVSTLRSDLAAANDELALVKAQNAALQRKIDAAKTALG